MIDFKTIRAIIDRIPSVKPFLNAKTLWMACKPSEYKTFDYMLRAVQGLVRGVYDGFLVRGDFLDTMANVISGQLTQAYQQALMDEGFTDFFLPDYLQKSLESMILKQYDYVDQYYADIMEARLSGAPIDPLLRRAELWAQRWTEAYNEAVRLIALHNGGRLEWKLGLTERHCQTCSALNGIVAFAREWDTLGVRPQNAPNTKLKCGGWKCDCSLSATNKRRSPNAYGRIEEIMLAR